jgi:uncharacterized membrane protein YphA (DoxX/SURF4 family)
MNIVLWILQIALAIAYAFHGLLYLTLSTAGQERLRQRRPDARPLGLPPAFRIFIGVAELAAVAGLILPGVTGILPWLTSLAALGLMIVMLGAIILHVSRHETSSVTASGVLLVLLTFVAYMRWQVSPLK